MDYLSHAGSDDSGPLERIRRPGFNPWMYAENVGCDFRAPAAVVRAWMENPRHRINIMHPDLTRIGIAIAESSSGRRHWVHDFGTPA